jgi:hypothetical protein
MEFLTDSPRTALLILLLIPERVWSIWCRIGLTKMSIINSPLNLIEVNDRRASPFSLWALSPQQGEITSFSLTNIFVLNNKRGYFEILHTSGFLRAGKIFLIGLHPDVKIIPFGHYGQNGNEAVTAAGSSLRREYGWAAYNRDCSKRRKTGSEGR